MDLKLSDDKTLLDVIEPREIVKQGYRYAEQIFGFRIAQRMLITFGRATHPDEVAEANLCHCASRFARLVRPDIKPAMPVTDRPVNANTQAQVDIAKLRFANAKRTRCERAKKLFAELNAWDLQWRLPKPTPTKETLALATDDERREIFALEKERENAFEDFESDVAKTLNAYGMQYDSFKDFALDGLICATFGTFKNPCKLGLRELDFIMHGAKKP